MKVGIPTMGNKGLKELVSPHFGRALTFTIVDMETNAVTTIPNTSEHMGGTGKPPELLIKQGVTVMLCSGLGPRAVHMFEDYGVMVYVGADTTVENTLEWFKHNQLTPATDANACKEHRH